MSDQSDDRGPDPKDEPDAGAAAGGRPSATEASEQAPNAEIVLDPDLEDEEPERSAEDQVERLEGHNRATFPGADETER